MGVLDQRIDDRLGIFAVDLHQHHVACLTFHERRDLAVLAAKQQVAFPVTRRNQHYKWTEELTRKRGDETVAFDGPRGRPSADRLSEIERLKRELKKVTEERDIPNKANSFF